MDKFPLKEWLIGFIIERCTRAETAAVRAETEQEQEE